MLRPNPIVRAQFRPELPDTQLRKAAQDPAERGEVCGQEGQSPPQHLEPPAGSPLQAGRWRLEFSTESGIIAITLEGSDPRLLF